MVTETDLELGDGRTLHAYDTGAHDAYGRLAVFWHHGSPNIGAPPEPLFSDADRLGIRWVAYDRPGYGGSTPRPDRHVASAAADASAVADALSIERFAVMGHSSGGSHALACAALLPERVLGVVVVAGMAPFGAEGLDWFEGFGPAGVAELRAAAAGRAALEKHLAQSDDEPEFTPEDEAALAGEWSWFIDVVRPALAGGMGGFIDDDLAGVGAWGLDPADVAAPALSCTGAGIGWCPPRTASGWRAIARCGTVAIPGRRAHLGSELWGGSGHELAPGARRRGLSSGWYSPECVEILGTSP